MIVKIKIFIGISKIGLFNNIINTSRMINNIIYDKII